jgi:hypothetical protein
MRQTLVPDRFNRPLSRALAILAGAALGACAPGLRSIAPSGLLPVSPDSVAAWLAPYRPTGPLHYDLKWRFVNQKGSTAGRAAVRVAPPDTMRFDYRGPFGRSGAAVVVGDSVLWAVPEKDTRDLLPAAPLFWAALGLPRSPPPDAALFGRAQADGHVWRYAAARDTMDFVEAGPGVTRLLMEVRRDGRIVASLQLAFQPGTRVPIETRVRFPQDGSALIFTVEGIQHVGPFEPSTWRHP